MQVLKRDKTKDLLEKKSVTFLYIPTLLTLVSTYRIRSKTFTAHNLELNQDDTLSPFKTDPSFLDCQVFIIFGLAYLELYSIACV